MTNHPSQLPEDKGELLALAYNNFEQCEADPEYTIDMTRYHSPELLRPSLPLGAPGRIIVRVCVAGSIMAKTLKAPKESLLDPYSHWTPLSAQDRAGLIWVSRILLDHGAPVYRHDPERFKSHFRDLITEHKGA